MIEVDGVVKRFMAPEGLIVAVDHVSFTAEKGAVYGLLGPNGAGKTTTLRVVSTLLSPDEGTARIAGFDVRTHPRDVRASIGFLSPTTRLYAKLTAIEVLLYFARMNGVAKPHKRVEELIESFGIGDYRDQRCERLSTGMAQKVNIARAVVHDPPVLILDEPTTGLDVMVSEVFLSFVERARADGRCVLFSTHIVREAERLCDRIGVIHEGRLRAEGTLDELRQRTGQRHLEDVFLAVVS